MKKVLIDKQGKSYVVDLVSKEEVEKELETISNIPEWWDDIVMELERQSRSIDNLTAVLWFNTASVGYITPGGELVDYVPLASMNGHPLFPEWIKNRITSDRMILLKNVFEWYNGLYGDYIDELAHELKEEFNSRLFGIHKYIDEIYK